MLFRCRYHCRCYNEEEEDALEPLLSLLLLSEPRDDDDDDDNELETVPNCCNRLFCFAAAVAISLLLPLI